MSTYQSICQDLKRLSESQLDQVADLVAALLAEQDPEPESDQAETNGNGRAAGGWVEVKIINGYGPYAYLRWRDGRRLRSKYLGKVVDLGSTTAPVNGKIAP